MDKKPNGKSQVKEIVGVKTALVLALFLVVPLLAQDDTKKKEPDNLTKARTTYQKEVARVTAPVLKDYIDQLDAMRKTFCAQGDVYSALAVQTEIELVRGQEAGNPKDWLTGTTWVSTEGRPDIRRFSKGNVHAETPGGGNFWDATYKITSKITAEASVQEKYRLLPAGNLLVGSNVYRRK